MADQHQNSSVDYSGSSADETNSCVVENSMWDEWTHPSNVGDEVSTSNFLPDLTTSSSSSRLTFHCQPDMLSSWMSTFHPLGLANSSLAAPEACVDIDPHPALFMHEAGLAAALDHPHSSSLVTDTSYPRVTSICSAHPGSEPTLPTYPVENESPLPLVSGINGAKANTVSRHVLQALGPQSPSSPLAIQNGMLNPLGDPWDGSSCPSRASTIPSWPIASTQNYSPSGTTHNRIHIPDHLASTIDHLEEGGGSTRVVSKPRHTDIFIGPNGTFESTPGGWTPQFYDGTTETTTSAMKPMKMMASLREAEESSSGLHNHHEVDSENRTMGSSLMDFRRGGQNVWFGKHRLELSVDGDDHQSALQLKRSKFSVGHGTSSAPKWADQGMRGGEILRTYNCPSGSLASQAMDIIAIGPALNTNGKPRARRGSATDPQSVYARQRRERINDRLKTLQHLVPNGAKVDIVTMLDEAYDYVKFLQYQVTLLKSDEFWMHATPYSYNGMDISNLSSAQTQELESSA